MNRFIALDFETSGLQPGRHAPVCLSVALFEDGKCTTSERWTIAPPKRDEKITREYDVIALEISGQKWADIKRGLNPRNACIALQSWVEEHDAKELTVVAFNAPFDFAWYSDLLFLGGQWNRSEAHFDVFVPPLFGPWQCLRLMVMGDHERDLGKYDLNTVIAHFGMCRESETHCCNEDAILTGMCYQKLIAERDSK